MKDKKLLSFGDDDDQDGEDGATFSSKLSHLIHYILVRCVFSSLVGRSWSILVCTECAVLHHLTFAPLYFYVNSVKMKSSHDTKSKSKKSKVCYDNSLQL